MPSHSPMPADIRSMSLSMNTSIRSMRRWALALLIAVLLAAGPATAVTAVNAIDGDAVDRNPIGHIDEATIAELSRGMAALNLDSSADDAMDDVRDSGNAAANQPRPEHNDDDRPASVLARHSNDWATIVALEDRKFGSHPIAISDVSSMTSSDADSDGGEHSGPAEDDVDEAISRLTVTPDLPPSRRPSPYDERARFLLSGNGRTTGSDPRQQFLRRHKSEPPFVPRDLTTKDPPLDLLLRRMSVAPTHREPFTVPATNTEVIPVTDTAESDAVFWRQAKRRLRVRQHFERDLRMDLHSGALDAVAGFVETLVFDAGKPTTDEQGRVQQSRPLWWTLFRALPETIPDIPLPYNFGLLTIDKLEITDFRPPETFEIRSTEEGIHVRIRNAPISAFLLIRHQFNFGLRLVEFESTVSSHANFEAVFVPEVVTRKQRGSGHGSDSNKSSRSSMSGDSAYERKEAGRQTSATPRVTLERVLTRDHAPEKTPILPYFARHETLELRPVRTRLEFKNGLHWTMKRMEIIVHEIVKEVPALVGDLISLGVGGVYNVLDELMASTPESLMFNRDDLLKLRHVSVLPYLRSSAEPGDAHGILSMSVDVQVDTGHYDSVAEKEEYHLWFGRHPPRHWNHGHDGAVKVHLFDDPASGPCRENKYTGMPWWKLAFRPWAWMSDRRPADKCAENMQLTQSDMAKLTPWFRWRPWSSRDDLATSSSSSSIDELPRVHIPTTTFTDTRIGKATMWTVKCLNRICSKYVRTKKTKDDPALVKRDKNPDATTFFDESDDNVGELRHALLHAAYVDVDRATIVF